MTVRRVETATGSHVEPPLNPRWSKLEQLRWHAAVAELDNGVPIRVRPVRGGYSIQAGMSSTSGHRFAQAWTYINGIRAGATAARQDA